MKFTEAQLEAAIIELLGEQGYPHLTGDQIVRAPTDVLIKEDLGAYLFAKYKTDDITEDEVDSVVKQLETLPASDLYESNKTFCKWLCDGFLLKREAVKGQEHKSKKDLYIQLIDYDDVVDGHNIFKVVSQLEIDSLSIDNPKRIPDGILYINGLPLVVFEFKSAIREEQAVIHDAYVQLTTRYRRDIPQLFVFNALCVISDGVNNKMGTLFGKSDIPQHFRNIFAGNLYLKF
jgi:type I restriction enzyme R subunit